MSYLIDDLPGLGGGGVAQDRGGALLADEEAVLEGRHRAREPGGSAPSTAASLGSETIRIGSHPFPARRQTASS